MTLDLYRRETLAPSREWVSLQPEERRRRAVVAAASRDVDVLWSLTQAHHTRRAGVSSAQTLRKYRLGLQRWLTYTAGQAVNVLHPEIEDADLWIREMESSGLKPSSVRVYLSGARQLYAALRWTKATRDDPFTDTKPQKDRTRPHDKRQPYSEADLVVMLASASLEMRVLLHLGASAGLRASEITGLTWGELDLEQATATVTGKGRKTRKVLLSGSLVRALRELGSGAEEQRVIGRTPEAARKRLQTLCQRVNVPYLGLHALRHAAGTRLIRAGFQLQDVAEHLGHSDVQTARTYAKWADERLRSHLRQN
ncbi:tyrosine-type recombinase/integrase [Deinococcus humi]|uniref:Integrase/recombinase XerC n=1 Tax=Deinococcus humi TaxID=662880 RepID=A0A7W8NJ27_9DEIO|nr:tyrosine-type recombinase/integrase [Deinococcus humi]MBB5365687.1 integrase/recombinase XerC [Deinococcus humi]GGO37129.1 integrase [Deinococcus humi]